jgi:glycosyltransferase involved in cell wall biosynthesis
VRHDVAIYTPHAAGIYDAAYGSGGGAERQTVMLARELVGRGLRTAHIVYPVEQPLRDERMPTLVMRPEQPLSRRGLVLEPGVIWRAMARADARLYVFRTAHASIGMGAAWTKLMRRRLIFSAANDSDFTMSLLAAHPTRLRLYKAGAEAADAIVVQSAQQVGMAHDVFPGHRVLEIPSFFESAPPARAPADGFLWAARLTEYKRPLAYLDLAEAMPEARFRMVGVSNPGDTSPELEAEVQRRAAALDNVELSPRRPHREVMELLERSAAIVNTSSTEGMPNVFLEAWARGIPALTLEFDADGRIERHGLGVSARGSWEDFLAGARDLWARREDRGGYGPAARAYVEATHGPAAVGAAWAGLIEDLL